MANGNFSISDSLARQRRAQQLSRQFQTVQPKESVGRTLGRALSAGALAFAGRDIPEGLISPKPAGGDLTEFVQKEFIKGELDRLKPKKESLADVVKTIDFRNQKRDMVRKLNQGAITQEQFDVAVEPINRALGISADTRAIRKPRTDVSVGAQPRPTTAPPQVPVGAIPRETTQPSALESVIPGLTPQAEAPTPQAVPGPSVSITGKKLPPKQIIGPKLIDDPTFGPIKVQGVIDNPEFDKAVELEKFEREITQNQAKAGVEIDKQSTIQIRKDAIKAQKDFNSMRVKIDNTMDSFTDVAKRTQELTGVPPGPLSGLLTKILQPTQLNEFVDGFNGGLVEVAAATARVSMPGTRAVRAIDIFKKTTVNPYQTIEAAVQTSADSFRNGLTNAIIADPSQFLPELKGKKTKITALTEEEFLRVKEISRKFERDYKENALNAIFDSNPELLSNKTRQQIQSDRINDFDPQEQELDQLLSGFGF